MKHFNLLKTLLLLCALIVGSLSSWAEKITYQHVFTAKPSTGSNVSLSSVKWDIAATQLGSYNSGNYAGVQLGSSKNNGSITLTSSVVWGMETGTYKDKTAITEVRLWLNLGGTSVTPSVTIGGKAAISDGTTVVKNSSAGSDWTKATKVTFTPASDGKTGVIVINVATVKAGYICAMEIDCEESGPIDARAVTTTTINVPDGFKTDLENGVDVAAGTLTATVTPAGSSALASPSIVWSSSDETVASIGASTGAVTLKKVGTTTITASYEGDESNYKPSSNTYVLNVVNTYAKGQVNNPYTVSEALAAISTLDNHGTIADQYVRGIVSTTGSISSGAVTYYISDNGVAENQLMVYKGKNTDGANFTNGTNLELGDEVLVYGTLQNYNSTPEFTQGSQVVSRITKTAPSFTLDVTEKTLDAYTHETVDVTLTTNTDGDVTCESSNPDVATVALKSAGVYTITAQSEGSATITIKSATSATYKPASATVAITVEDGRADAGISFAETDIKKTWGESFTGQALTNTNSVDVTYSSTDESVATVSSTGVVSVLKAGSTTIKATFTGNATYKATVASYDLTINKAEAGLSFVETEFDVDLNDDSFVAPVLNNPNSLTVTELSQVNIHSSSD